MENTNETIYDSVAIFGRASSAEDFQRDMEAVDFLEECGDREPDGCSD